MTPVAESANLHATTVAFGPEDGVMIEGPSGSGKSSLALQLIGAGAQLVSDDRTILFARGGHLFARAPVQIAGLIEVRGLGILRMAARRLARLRLVIELTTDPRAVVRSPEPAICSRLGCDIAWLGAMVCGSSGSSSAHSFAMALARSLGTRSAHDRSGAGLQLWSI